MSSAAVCQFRLHTVSSAAHSQPTISEFSCTHSGPLQSVSPSLTCQLSCNLTAALQSFDLAICRLWLQLVSWAAVCQLGCHVPSLHQPISSGTHLSAPLQIFSSSAISWLGCSQSALLHSVTSFAALPALCQSSCSLSAQLYFVSSAAIYLL